MERRHFLKLSVGFIAGSVALAASAQAAMLPPIAAPQPSAGKDVEPAVVGQQEVDRLKPEEVRWGHHGHVAGVAIGTGTGIAAIGAGTVTVGTAGIGATTTGTVTTGEAAGEGGRSRPRFVFAGVACRQTKNPA